MKKKRGLLISALVLVILGTIIVIQNFNYSGPSNTIFESTGSDASIISINESNTPISSIVESDGLEFIFNDNLDGYIVSIGTCTNPNIVVPSQYHGLPVVEIGNFIDCYFLVSIVIPNSVTSIENNAFCRCSSLELVIFESESKLISIGYDAFKNCTLLGSIEIPGSVTYIGDSAFYGCNSLKYNEYVNCYYLGNKENPYLLLVGAKDTNVLEVTINENTRIIMYSAFGGCSLLNSIVIPNSVISIGNSAFADCISLNSIVMSNSLTTIGSSAFHSCVNLTLIDIPSNVTYIGNNSFMYCRSLNSVVIPNSVEYIGYYAFYSCSSLIIYCEVSSQPNEWNSDWNYNVGQVYWSGEWSYVDGVPTPNV